MTNPYQHFDDQYTDTPVPQLHLALCGDNWFGNILYPLWRDLSCTCCAMWRGIMIGGIVGLGVGVLMGVAL